MARVSGFCAIDPTEHATMIFRFVPHASLTAALIASVAFEPGSAHAQNRGQSAKATPVAGPTALSVPTDPITGRSVATGRILVRVKPEYSIAAPRGGEAGELTSRTGMDLSALRDALDTIGARCTSMVDLTVAQTAELRDRARRRSGRWSRDLSDWLVVQSKGDLLSNATYLRNLDMVDLVEIESRVNPSQCPSPPGECSDLFDAECANQGIFPPYPDTGCANCGGLQGGGAIAGCIDLINEWYSGDVCVGPPICAGGTAIWDWGCLTMSNFLCAPPNGPAVLYESCGNVTGGPPGQPDPTTGGGSWSTFTAGHLQHHQMQSAAALNGSREPNCCAIVCAVNYLCCSIAWDADCAASALTIPDCYITRDYFADLIDVDVTNAQTTAATANRSIYALNPAFQAAGQPTGVSSFDQGNPYDPTTLATPYYGDSLLLLGETFNPGAGADFPLAAAQTITQPALSPGLDGVSGQVAAGSMPLALWGTRLRQLPPPGTPDNPDFFPFMRTTTFLGGGLDVAYMEFLSNALFGQSDLSGQGIRVGVVDLSMYVNHEEFLVAGVSKIVVEPGQSPFLINPTPVACDCGGFEATAEDCCTRCDPLQTNPALCVDVSNPTYPPDGYVVYPEHGTAVMSVLVANQDTKGVTGLAYGAEPWFFPALSATGTSRTSAAIAGAAYYLTEDGLDGLPPSNVCVIPMETANGFQPLNSINEDAPEQGQAIRDVLSQGIDAGLCFVMAAGNGAQIVSPAQVREADTLTADTQNCVVVGAVWPGFQLQLPVAPAPLPEEGPAPPPDSINPLGFAAKPPAVWPGNDYCRVGMSNYLNPEPDVGTDNLTISGWGYGVCAAGFGDLFLGDDAGAGLTAAVTPPERSHLRRYTANFDGTSAATAMIGGAAVLLQQFAKLQFDGLGVPPEQMRNVLRGSPPGSGTASSIFPQCGQVTPPQVSTDPKWGDTGAEDTGIASVRGFPDLRVMALEVNTGEWFDPSNDASVELITGKEINQVNPYAVSTTDDFYLKARSVRARGSSGGFGPSVPYALPNRVVDVQVARNTGFGSPDEALKINVEGNTTILGSGLTLCMVFVYNAVTNRWEFWLPEDGELQVLTGGVPTAWVVQSPGCSPASAYVVSDQGQFKVFTRVVTMAGGTGGNYQCWHDQIKVQINAVGELYTVGDCGGATGQP
jgi:hypothetical protein